MRKGNAEAGRAYDEIIDLFARSAPAGRILAFRPSRKTRDRVRFLLERNKSGRLTKDEAAELERFGQIEHLMQLVKARAQLYAENKQ